MSPTRADAPRHPAPYPRYVFQHLLLELGAERREVGRVLDVLDPFAGIGRIHDLPKRLAKTTGVELEPEWAELRKGTVTGDATALPAGWSARFDALVTSPAYGNRLSDHHEAKDGCAVCNGTGSGWTEEGCAEAPFLCSECHSVSCVCGGFAKAMRAHNQWCPGCSKRLCKGCNGSGLSRRYTYRHALGRPLSDRNAGAMEWGDAYRVLHAEAWAEAHRVTRPGGLLLVNVKNHIRHGTEQLVAEWHVQELQRQGFRVDRVVCLSAKGIRDGASYDERVKYEHVIVGRAL